MSAAAVTLASVPTDMAVRAMRKSISEHFGSSSARRLSHPAHMFNLDSTPDLTDKVAVITGGAEGVGYAVAHTMLKHNISRIHLMMHSFEAALSTMADLQTELGNDLAGRVTYHQVDFGDWYSVYTTAQNITARETRLDIVINNATTTASSLSKEPTSSQTTPEGIDRSLATNHFGHVVLVSALLMLLKRTAEDGDTVRIVNQASDAHADVSLETAFLSMKELEADLGSSQSYYARSKLANILYTRYLARHLTLDAHPNIIVNAVNPGLTEDEAELISNDRWAVAEGTMFAATVTERSGEYICRPGNPIKGSDMARDSTLGERLMQLTRQVLCERLGTADWWDF